MTASERISSEVGSWDEVETGPGRFGSVRFTVGRRELGHLHGDSIADLPLRPEIAQKLISTGQARDHRYTPRGSGWVTIELDTDEDADRVIELMRSSYERAIAKRAARRNKAGALPEGL
jgi:predicted DNA-binding protein (MmcQ/YjbR family)